MEMECYQKMYARLCAVVSESIDLLDDANNILLVKALLQKALWDAEELYISQSGGE